MDLYLKLTFEVKNQEIKEKNIKQLSKYEVSVSIDVKFTDTLKKIVITLKTLSGDYSVAKQYSQTLNNEKNIRTLNK